MDRLGPKVQRVREDSVDHQDELVKLESLDQVVELEALDELVHQDHQV